MKKGNTIQANYRLPQDLLSDLRSVAEEEQLPQSAIVTAAVQTRVAALKKKIQRRKEKEQAVALA
jgi:hypothetical protein